MGCASVKLHVWLEFLKVLFGFIDFGWWVTIFGMVGDPPRDYRSPPTAVIT